MDTTPIHRAITCLGSRRALANAVGVSQQAVYEWLHSTRPSPESAIAIEAATKGFVSRSDLRPDLWPSSLYRHHPHIHNGD